MQEHFCFQLQAHPALHHGNPQHFDAQRSALPRRCFAGGSGLLKEEPNDALSSTGKDERSLLRSFNTDGPLLLLPANGGTLPPYRSPLWGAPPRRQRFPIPLGLQDGALPALQ